MAEAAGPRSLRQLVDAMLVVGSDLDLHNVLQRIVESARNLADAQYAALGVLDESGRWLADFITVGIDEETHRRIGALPKGNGILGVLTRDAEALRLPDLREHEASSGFPPGHPPMRSFLGVPVRVGDRIFGNLYLTDKESSEVFTDVDEELVTGLAAAAGIAIEKAWLHSQLKDMALLDDQERIARDLHDRVIQRVFGVGLILQGTRPLVRANPDTAITRIDTAIAELDLTIQHLRSAIFGLDVKAQRAQLGIRSRVLELVGESADALGFEPSVMFTGPIEAQIDSEIGNELAAVITESLSNAARHANASRVEIQLVVTDVILLRIEDDGVGPPAASQPRGNGLNNMTARAARLSGTFDIRPGTDRGTIIEWSVPLSRD
ncbi:MAG: GAF domain-containing protein [Acidimicrobiia bacterium]